MLRSDFIPPIQFALLSAQSACPPHRGIAASPPPSPPEEDDFYAWAKQAAAFAEDVLGAVHGEDEKPEEREEEPEEKGETRGVMICDDGFHREALKRLYSRTASFGRFDAALEFITH